MEAKFTKGPWQAYIQQRPEGFRAQVISFNPDLPPCGVTIFDAPSTDETKANSWLIAAAPEMYEALSSYFKQAQLNGSQIAGEQLYPLARAVLEKARGES